MFVVHCMTRRMWCNKVSFGRSGKAIGVYVSRLEKQNHYGRFSIVRRTCVGSNSSGPLSSKRGTAGRVAKSPREDLGEPTEFDNVPEDPLSVRATDNNEEYGIKKSQNNEKRGAEVPKLTPLPKSFVFCPLCGRGHGVMKCGKCGGKGVVLTRPGGAGVAGVVGKARCSICNGLGKVPCLLCGGNEST